MPTEGVPVVRRLVGATIVAAMAAVLLVVSAAPAHACSCAGVTDAEAFANADVVLTGELVETRAPEGPSFSSSDPTRLIFDVEQVHKGGARAHQSVVTPSDGGACGLSLGGAAGPYLVFASTEPEMGLAGADGELYAHLCGGTRDVSVAPVPAAFGPGAPPAPGASPIGAEGGRSVSGPVLLAGALVVGAALGGAVWMRRRPAPAR